TSNERSAAQLYGAPATAACVETIKPAEAPSRPGRGGGAVPRRVTAILLDGQRISREIDYAPGFAAQPMDRDEVERKFRGNVGQRWPQEHTDTVLQALWALDRTDDLSSVLNKFAFQT